ncbi:hypothetical protein [Pendulispora albinea]|uniref:Uncharacterized protein n=1 Tax=Pendulispora albinea TaxID=2741071 RepID=A0ABZ2M5E2_9BACT
MQAFGTGSTCAVCGERDARALTSLRLAGGEPVVVCGTHELMHRRVGRTARSIEELRALVSERRKSADRRAANPDELASALSQAFAPDRRESDRRA